MSKFYYLKNRWHECWRRWFLNIGTLIALSIYYLNYGADFNEGEISNGSSLTLFFRIISIVFILLVLFPIRIRNYYVVCVSFLYLYGLLSFIAAFALNMDLNDVFYFNTLLQLPVLLALVGTRWQVDYAEWMKFICRVLVVQVLVDILLWMTGFSLWLSLAFVGGVGNPSSFGLLCAIGMAFCVFHPSVGRERWGLAILLALGALQTKSLFAMIAVIVIGFMWMVTSWQRAIASFLVGFFVLLFSLFFLNNENLIFDTDFLMHKLKAVGALLRIVEYDIESSGSVSQRVEIHVRTFSEIASAPINLIWGHLTDLSYWPMDSQLLTYLGSFGLLFLVVFLLLHIYWGVCAWRIRYIDNGFSMLAILIFGFVFLTNRILDYFPVAIIYFLIVSYVLQLQKKILKIKIP